MENQDRVCYTKEELAAQVKVPAVVEQDLKRIISERLDSAGFYYRIFSRIKTSESMARKFAWKEYTNERRLQDLVGVRVNLYFDDDVDICKEIMENTFDLLEWASSERSEEEFKPAKLNGVFRLPEYLKAEISPQTWEMCIDDTFEIQIKTMFFEGWHEIEHDMRYKGEELWSHFPGFSRYFNSILATLELCDKSMVTLFEDMGHALYKSGQWPDMIRTHFRVKMTHAELYPEVAQVLDEDQKNTNSLGKRIYRTSKRTLARELLSRGRRIPINVNTIIAVLNESDFHDERLSAIFRKKDVFNDGREESVGETRLYRMEQLQPHIVFQMNTLVDGNRMRTQERPQLQQIFEKAASVIHSWMYTRYLPLFKDIPETPADYLGDMMGYQARLRYDPSRRQLKMHVRHLDLEIGGRIWFSECFLGEEDGAIRLKVLNGYAEPEPGSAGSDLPGMFFSYPGFYKAVVDGVGIFNGIECFNRRRILHADQARSLGQCLADPARTFPVVLIISKRCEDDLMDEGWLGAFRVSDFTRTVWRYTHVFTCYEDLGREALNQCNLDGDDPDAVPSFYLFWPDGRMDRYTPEDIDNCSFGRHLEARGDSRTYDIVYGGQAFYHKIVTDLRDWNVSSGMWGGFHQEKGPIID